MRQIATGLAQFDKRLQAQPALGQVFFGQDRFVQAELLHQRALLGLADFHAQRLDLLASGRRLLGEFRDDVLQVVHRAGCLAGLGLGPALGAGRRCRRFGERLGRAPGLLAVGRHRQQHRGHGLLRHRGCGLGNCLGGYRCGRPGGCGNSGLGDRPGGCGNSGLGDWPGGCGNSGLGYGFGCGHYGRFRWGTGCRRWPGNRFGAGPIDRLGHGLGGLDRLLRWH